VKPAAFTYHRAHDVTDAVGLLTDLAAAGEDPKLIAGGQSLMPMMTFRLARPSALVDLGPLRRVPAMTAIAESSDDGSSSASLRLPGTLTLGALVTHHAVETAALSPGFAVLTDAMRWVGHLPIRSRGTVAGSLVHGDATAEWCLLALLLDAVVVAEGPAGRREIPADELFHGFYATAVDPDEVVVEVRFTRPAPHAALSEFARRHGDFAIVDAAVALEIEDHDVTGGRVVLGGVAPAPVRVPEAEAVLAGGGAAGDALFAAVADAAAAAIDPPDDPPVTAAYRRRLTRTLVADACRRAAHPTAGGAR
jgi:carbon-monoxide dehydrogenase medium subunit